MTALRTSQLTRTLVALLCAVAFVHVQWVGMFQGGSLVRQAYAQNTVNSTVAVLVVPIQRKNADDAESLELLLSDAANRLDSVRLFELSPAPNPDATVQAGQFVEEGLRAVLLRTPKRAQERLEAAVKVLTDNPTAGDERLFARLYKGQGLVWLANNEVVRARDAVLKSLILFPNQTPEEYAAYGSNARELYVSVKEVLANTLTGDLKVAVTGPRADIWIDGTYRGNTTAEVEGVPVGAHLVTVRSSGMVTERRFVEVQAKKASTAEFELKPATFGPDLDQGRNVLIANFSQPAVVEDRIRELRNQLGADQMLVLRPKLGKKATELTGYALGADGTFRKVEATLDKDENYLNKLAEFVATTVGSKLLPDPNTLPLDQRQSVLANSGAGTAGPAVVETIDPDKELFGDEKKAKPLTGEWWFWAGVAGGAALVGGALWWLASTGATAEDLPAGDLLITLHKTSGN
ncbi:MAG: PEGA domain-containing protein [Myxococcota bacterium]